MEIIKLTPLEEGVYCAVSSDTVPKGWAIIPEDFEKPSTFPRLKSLEAIEVNYPYEVEIEKEVTKYRDVEVMGEDGEPVIVQEEYTEKEVVTETRDKYIPTVTKMTEGTLPEPEPYVPTNDELQWQAITDIEITQMEQTLLLSKLNIIEE